MNKKGASALLALAILGTSFSPNLAHASTTSNPRVNWLIEKRWVEGRDGGDLALDKNISRAEFVKMVLATKDLLGQADSKKDIDSKFKDVPNTHWANGIINLAAEKGLIKGDDNGNFRPDDPITYNEVLTILVRLNPNFIEGAIIGENWASQYVEYGKNHGYLKDVNITESQLSQNAMRERVFEIVYNTTHLGLNVNTLERTNNDLVVNNSRIYSRPEFVWPYYETILNNSNPNTREERVIEPVRTRPVEPTPSIPRPIIVTEKVKRTEIILYETKREEDSNLEKGKEVVSIKGQNGLKEITEEVTNVDGVVSRVVIIGERIVKEPINEIIKFGTKVTDIKPLEGTDVETTTEKIPFETKYKDDPTLEKGKEVVKQEGEEGEKEITLTYKTEDGKRVGEPTRTERTTKEPVDKIILRGTKPLEGTDVETTTEKIPFETKYKDDPTLEKGKEVVKQEGEEGEKEITLTYKTEDGKRVGEPTRTERTTKEPKDKIIVRGTKEEVKTHTVTFNKEDGTQFNTVKVNDGDPVKEIAAPNKDGHDFIGWFTENGEKYNFYDKVTKDIVLLPKYQIKVFTVKFSPNSGYKPGDMDVVNNKRRGKIDEEKVKYEDKVKRPDYNPMRIGYEFIGWYINPATDSKPYDFSSPVKGNLTLKAKYKELSEKETIQQHRYLLNEMFEDAETIHVTNKNPLKRYNQVRYTFDYKNNPEDITVNLYINENQMKSFSGSTLGIISLSTGIPYQLLSTVTDYKGSSVKGFTAPAEKLDSVSFNLKNKGNVTFDRNKLEDLIVKAKAQDTSILEDFGFSSRSKTQELINISPLEVTLNYKLDNGEIYTVHNTLNIKSVPESEFYSIGK